MNQNEFCDIFFVIIGVSLIFYISTRKQKELFKICGKKQIKLKKKNKKKLKVKSFDKIFSNNSNISKSFLSKEQIKNTVNDQNIIIKKLNNLDNETKSNETKSNETKSNETKSNETDSNENNLDDEIDGFVKIDNYGNIDLSFSDNNITNVPTSYNYNNQDLSKLNNYRNLENEYTIISYDKINNEKLEESKSSEDVISENDEELDNSKKNIDTSFDNANLSKNCYIQVGGNDNQDLVYGLQQNEIKSFKKPDITSYENEKKCTTLKNAVLNLNRTGYLKSDLVEKSWNETFKPECGNL